MYNNFKKNITAMAFLFVQLLIAVSVASLFLLVYGLNEWLVVKLYFIPGINWFSLPAGLCVLTTLLFGIVGAVGILTAYVLLYSMRSKSLDATQAGLGALAHAVAPYLVYLAANRLYGLRATLSNLTSERLLFVIFVCCAICPAFQILVISNSGDTLSVLHQYMNMFAGNLVGALTLVYFLRAFTIIVS